MQNTAQVELSEIYLVILLKCPFSPAGYFGNGDFAPRLVKAVLLKIFLNPRPNFHFISNIRRRNDRNWNCVDIEGKKTALRYHIHLLLDVLF